MCACVSKVLKCNYFANDKLVSDLGDKRGFFLKKKVGFKYNDGIGKLALEVDGLDVYDSIVRGKEGNGDWDIIKLLFNMKREMEMMIRLIKGDKQKT